MGDGNRTAETTAIIYHELLFPESFRARGQTKGIFPHEVPGASESEGSRLSNPSQASHCLGEHDGQTLLYGPRLATPEGHVVRFLSAAALHQPADIWF